MSPWYLPLGVLWHIFSGPSSFLGRWPRVPLRLGGNSTSPLADFISVLAHVACLLRTPGRANKLCSASSTAQCRMPAGDDEDNHSIFFNTKLLFCRQSKILFNIVCMLPMTLQWNKTMTFLSLHFDPTSTSALSSCISLAHFCCPIWDGHWRLRFAHCQWFTNYGFIDSKNPTLMASSTKNNSPITAHYMSWNGQSELKPHQSFFHCAFFMFASKSLSQQSSIFWDQNSVWNSQEKSCSSSRWK